MDPTRRPTRRTVLCGCAGLAGAGLAGCSTAREDPVFDGSFETGLDGWTTHSDIGPEEPQDAFEWSIGRSQAQAVEGDWSLEVFTEGDHDDGVAWATTELAPPADAAALTVTLDAWSESESFNHLRDLVAYLGPQAPSDEGSFPGPGENSTGVDGAAFGGLREPLHLAEGWREYRFEWAPESVPDRLALAVGVAVVWEADATHYVDDITVTAG